MSDLAGLLRMHADALAALDASVRDIDDADLARATPCAAWRLADLLAHEVGQHHGFAAAARDGDAPASAYEPRTCTTAAWEASVRDILDGFAAADPAAPVVVVELHPTRALPLATVVGAQLLDTVVHHWDVARALGRPFAPPSEQTTAVLAIAETIPDGEGREGGSAAFAHVVPTAATGWERVLALLGRDPAWSAGSEGGVVPRA